ncbi:MAG: hypothetical protein KGL39_26410 [Patescibacteria group bacterium]|nr:hypothetical protein [Patescibacteria group bacterium]
MIQMMSSSGLRTWTDLAETTNLKLATDGSTNSVLLFRARLVHWAFPLTWKLPKDPTVTGVKIYIGTNSHSYFMLLDVGMTNRACIIAPIGQTNYFAATTYNAERVESDFSNEASWSVTNRPVLKMKSTQ